ncbi:Predicted DNA-binding transcriptional regulator YafY, contains an HTH and WYL domains [Lachnospiraceae bacterium XBB2008]|nr:Predicted DNA-binding transcriptional regulator YafY, contains an HTH and WYL domains [Lachnospiraceae bacterium XBB2008]
MPKGTNQKLKLYYLSQIMTQKTDDEHMLTLPEIQEHLLAYDVTADRKSLYDDMEALRVLGIDVIGEKVGRNYYYHVGSKQFDIAELKLLVDAIQSSKFITEKKSNELIKKITGLASEYEASQLKRTVTVQGRVKTMNESIYYIVDDIHRAIAENKQIRFEYMKWTTDKKLVPRRDEPYVMSPWALTWDDENYYLIAYDETGDMIRHFRVDKMKQIELLNVKRAGKERFREFDLAEYSKMSFGMFAGEKTRIKLEFKDEMVGVMIDRFGKDIPIRPGSKTGWSETSVDVALSNQFFGWLFGLGSGVRIVSPQDVVDQYTNELSLIAEIYGMK